jgi:cysteine desulfurase
VPLQFGGGQERGLRSGTLPTHQIVGMGEACRLAAERMAVDVPRIEALRERLWRGLAVLPGVELNGDPLRRVAGILNVTVDGVEGETLLLALADLALSSGSACASLSAEPSYVLRALGRSDRLAQSSLRLSLGRCSTEGEVDFAAARIVEEVLRLRAGASRRGEWAPPPDEDPRYSEEVLRRLHGLPGWGRLDGVPGRVTGRAGDREQGAAVELFLQVESGRILAARFEAFGCPHLLAAASWLVETLPGFDQARLAAWDWQQVAMALQVPAARFGRLLTLQDAARDAGRNWALQYGSTV